MHPTRATHGFVLVSNIASHSLALLANQRNSARSGGKGKGKDKDKDEGIQAKKCRVKCCPRTAQEL